MIRLLFIFLAVVLPASLPCPAADALTYPMAEKKPIIDSYFGIDLVDDYSWMGNTADPVVKAYAAAQNERTLAQMRNNSFLNSGQLPPLETTAATLKATTKDGTSISLSTVRLKEISSPGPFLFSTTPGTPDKTWLCNGGGCVTTTLPKREKLADSLDDLIICVRFLFDRKITTPDQLYLNSDDGLLAATALVQYPALFRAVVVRPAKFDGLQEGFATIKERSTFQTAIANSPYRRIAEGTTYPAVLLLADPAKDTFSHVLKMATRLQTATTRPHPIFFLEQGRDAEANILAFLLHELGTASH